MIRENFQELVSVAIQVATRINKRMAVFKLDNTYYMVDASEWENGRSYGQYIMTVEPVQN
ncbi:hypothetical protein VF14_13520 [Nostoc linckia z18]|uniref:Uncharacterized protein n=2 Tax=Nostoc linckia TaxID=92942 RepID=A0A9Q5ZC31_NOSLI|nr:hypothetical protein VF02_26080 [Nostoc linckia z1]PHJ61901.1 hypothetical protein VF05_27775 [Nostoc linckia z3]PHJ67818.1 hypothetical protein VF03_25525 [Nostoc linckia z2]PHJ78998.1 hypothetical protein VF06_27450 [Nostoc linckia z4]PHJ83325.1 hypothetical protein VF07_27020 [Nostoc linckia z6]PHJ95626.1 hypothetical protein VF04_18510 [Nostoc linckia z7]PHK03556.1 hypothetical protein VF08_14620 [Nostoc linckia z8]PHK09767.1 hypothetical protein VF09_14010 [Nostoc linckia z9]PHK1990